MNVNYFANKKHENIFPWIVCENPALVESSTKLIYHWDEFKNVNKVPF